MQLTYSLGSWQPETSGPARASGVKTYRAFDPTHPSLSPARPLVLALPVPSFPSIPYGFPDVKDESPPACDPPSVGGLVLGGGRSSVLGAFAEAGPVSASRITSPS